MTRQVLIAHVCPCVFMPLASAIVFHLLEALDRPCQVVSLSEETMDHLTNDWYLNLELSQFKIVCNLQVRYIRLSIRHLKLMELGRKVRFVTPHVPPPTLEVLSPMAA